MSNRTRIALASLIGLALLVAVFSSVGGSTASAGQERLGSHLVSGSRVNLDHYRESAPAPAAANELIDEFGPGRPMGCHHESQTSPED